MKLTLTALAAALLYATTGQAGDIAPGDVQFNESGGIDQSLTGVAGDPVNGEEIMVTRPKGNCVACHQISALDYAPFHGEVGPTLDGVASIWDEAQLRGLLVNAKMTYEGTIMPAFYKVSGFIRPGDAFTTKPAPPDLPPILSAQEIEDVLAYLVTLKGE